MELEITRGELSHKRNLTIKYEGETFTFKATNGRDRFPDELMDRLRELASEMFDHNYMMDIRDQERK